jgi:putative ABC transport system substrate-binding protein
MRRRGFVTFLGGAAVAWPVPLRAQEAGKSYRVAYLTLAGGQDAVIVKQRLKELGYSEGKNLIFDYRSAEGKMERLPQLAAESAATNPDVIVAGFGTETAKAAQAASTTIPIVFTSAGDPIGAGIVKSLNRPGANITGLTSQTAEISGKRLQILEQVSPGIRIIAVIVSPGYPFTTVALPQLRTAAEDGVLLRFLIDGKPVSEARSVSYRGQPAELFQVPRGYTPLLAPEGGPVP